MSTFKHWIHELNFEVHQMEMEVRKNERALLDMYAKKQIIASDLRQKLDEIELERDFIRNWYIAGRDQIRERKRLGLLA